MSRIEEAEALLRAIGAADGTMLDLAAEAARRQAQWTSSAAALAGRLECLQAALVERHGYRGDRETYDDLQNADLMRVIDRRRGLPVALGILFIHCARSQGWDMAGLASPGHFLVRLEHDGLRAILDPFNGGRALDLEGLRALVRASGVKELAPRRCEPVPDREVLLRLQNNLKLRLIQAGDLPRAATLVERMLLFAPAEIGLWREAGVLHAQLGNLRAAMAALERFVAAAPEGADRREAAILLQAVRGHLH